MPWGTEPYVALLNNVSVHVLLVPCIIHFLPIHLMPPYSQMRVAKFVSRVKVVEALLHAGIRLGCPELLAWLVLCFCWSCGPESFWVLLSSLFGNFFLAWLGILSCLVCRGAYCHAPGLLFHSFPLWFPSSMFFHPAWFTPSACGHPCFSPPIPLPSSSRPVTCTKFASGTANFFSFNRVTRLTVDVLHCLSRAQRLCVYKGQSSRKCFTFFLWNLQAGHLGPSTLPIWCRYALSSILWAQKALQCLGVLDWLQHSAC